MDEKILNARQAEVLEAERRFFTDIQHTVEAFGIAPEDRILLEKVFAGLNQLFMLVVVGEFNSGKSAFINALIGRKVLTEGVTPTTSQINVLRYGETASQHSLEAEVLEVIDPAPFLQEISIVDTPGTNAIIERHQALTEEFVPRSDLVLFITSSERPFTESERRFLEKVSNWGKKILVVLNKVDLLETTEDVQRVVQFVIDGFKQKLGLEPPVFPVAGKLAFQAKNTTSGPDALRLWQKSGFGPLETYIFQTLDQSSRVRLKLQSPLKVADRLLTTYHTTTKERLTLLDQDARTVDNIERQLKIYQEDMRRDFDARLTRINGMLANLNERADKFFDDVLKITRLFELLRGDKEKFKHIFEERVVADTPRRIEQAVQEMVEWTVERESRIWNEVTLYLKERRQADSQNKLIGEADNAFEAFNRNRRLLLQQIGEQARLLLQSFDQKAEAEKLNQQIRDAVSQTTWTEIGAVGLGAGLIILLGTAAWDFTGILLALVVGGAGFYIIPARRRKAKEDFRHKLETLRGQLTSVLREQFEHELIVSAERVREAISPYTRFIRTEQDRLSGLEKQFSEHRRELARLQTSIEAATPQAVAPRSVGS